MPPRPSTLWMRYGPNGTPGASGLTPDPTTNLARAAGPPVPWVAVTGRRRLKEIRLRDVPPGRRSVQPEKLLVFQPARPELPQRIDRPARAAAHSTWRLSR